MKVIIDTVNPYSSCPDLRKKELEKIDSMSVTVNSPTLCWEERCPTQKSCASVSPNDFFIGLRYDQFSPTNEISHVLFEIHEFLMTGLVLSSQKQRVRESIRTSLLEANRIHLRNLIDIFSLRGFKTGNSFQMELKNLPSLFSKEEVAQLQNNYSEDWLFLNRGKAKSSDQQCWSLIFVLLCRTTDHCGPYRFKNSEKDQEFIYKNNTINHMISVINDFLSESNLKGLEKDLQKIQRLLKHY
jgi:hypothetical protein